MSVLKRLEELEEDYERYGNLAYFHSKNLNILTALLNSLKVAIEALNYYSEVMPSLCECDNGDGIGFSHEADQTLKQIENNFKEVKDA